MYSFMYTNLNNPHVSASFVKENFKTKALLMLV